jgi:hypothetical protein
MFSAKSFVIIILLIAALGVLVAFQMWLVAAAMLLLLAGLALHESGEGERLEKLESRISLVQVSGQEVADKICKGVSDLSDAVNFLRGELQQVSGNVEGRIASIEQRFQSEHLDTQKYYDLVQKIIQLENRVSAISNREKEESTEF